MKKMNDHGFSLIELMAVLVLSSIVIVPLLISFTSSIEINSQARTNRVAASVAEGALYTIEKIDFSAYRTALDTAIGNGNDYLELNEDECSTNFINPTNVAVCDSVFAMTSSNLSFDATTFRVFLFEYSLTTLEHSGLTTNQSIPLQVRNELSRNTDITDALDGPDNQQLIWIILWLDYYDDPELYLVSTGIIANDDYTGN